MYSYFRFLLATILSFFVATNICMADPGIAPGKGVSIKVILESLDGLISAGNYPEAINKCNEALTQLATDSYSERNFTRILPVVVEKRKIAEKLILLGVHARQATVTKVGSPIKERLAEVDKLFLAGSYAEALVVSSDALTQLAIDDGYTIQDYVRYTTVIYEKIKIISYKAGVARKLEA
jgi:hypothetical protein